MSWTPLPANAQEKRVRTIGFLGASTPQAMSEWVSAFVRRLHELGWNEGQNLAIEYRWADGHAERLPALVGRGRRRRVDGQVAHQGLPLPGLPGSAPDKDGKDKKEDAQRPASKDAMTAKATNDAVALIRSLAELRGRNADWAEKAVREAASLSASSALQAHVIDLVARNPAELLEQINGRSVELAGGDTRQLATKGLTIEGLDPGWLIRFLSVITDPNVAFILLIVGIYGLIIEFSTPGAIAPGVVGTICLLLGLYALNMLPINYAGLALMLLGIIFLVVEAFTPTVVLGLGGVAAFLLGSAMLLKIEAPGYRLSWTVVIIAMAMIVSLTVIVLGSLWRARRKPARVGGQAMRGLPAEVLDWSGSEGHVFTQGERWQARGAEALTPGEVVEVAGIKDLTLVVRRRSARTVSEGGV